MYPFGGIPIAAALSGYLTWVWCRGRARRGDSPTAWAVFAPPAIGVLVALLCTFQFDVFRPELWSKGKVALWIDMLLAGVPSLLLSLTVSAVIGLRYDRGQLQSERLEAVKSAIAALLLLLLALVAFRGNATRIVLPVRFNSVGTLTLLGMPLSHPGIRRSVFAVCGRLGLLVSVPADERLWPAAGTLFHELRAAHVELIFREPP